MITTKVIFRWFIGLIIIFVLMLTINKCKEKPSGLIDIRPRVEENNAASVIPGGFMPDSAISTDRYLFQIARVTDITGYTYHPQDTIDASTNYHIRFNYKTEILNTDTTFIPNFDFYREITIDNDSTLWDPNYEANVYWDIYIPPGAYEFFVSGINDFGVSRSNRYDFFVKGTKPARVIIGGFK